jgi:hypothetical protein
VRFCPRRFSGFRAVLSIFYFQQPSRQHSRGFDLMLQRPSVGDRGSEWGELKSNIISSCSYVCFSLALITMSKNHLYIRGCERLQGLVITPVVIAQLADISASQLTALTSRRVDQVQ